jgi:hypothetical protein
MKSRMFRVSEETWHRVQEIKLRDRHKNIDSVIRLLLTKAGEA